jgi:hypothetical protein
MAVLSAILLPVATFAQAQPNIINGSFLLLDRNLNDRTLSFELGKMKLAGMGTVVLVSVGQLDGDEISSPNAACTSLSSVIYPTALPTQNPTTTDMIQKTLSIAYSYGMSVYLGSLQTAGLWYTGIEHNAMRSCNKAVAQELYARYGSSSAFAGFYFTQELWLNWVKSYATQQPPAVYYGATWLREFVSDVAAVAPGKVVMAAPVAKKQPNGAMPGLTATEAGTYMGQLLSISGLKIVAPQDGQGASGSSQNVGAPSLTELPSYYAAMQVATQQNGAALWAVVETFNDDGNGLAVQGYFKPGPISRITQQISMAAPYATKMLSWIFGHDMSPEATYYPVLSSKLRNQGRKPHAFRHGDECPPLLSPAVFGGTKASLCGILS